MIQYTLEETRSKLEDGRLDLGLKDPKQLNYLTYSSDRQLQPEYSKEDIVMHFKFTLSNEVVVQKRVVYNMFTMFGDVGGLLDFILIVLTPIFSYFSSSLSSATLVSKLYHASESEPKPVNTNLTPF